MNSYEETGKLISKKNNIIARIKIEYICMVTIDKRIILFSEY